MIQALYRLLVVDDEDTTRRSLADILRLEGYLVETANGGQTAIDMIAQHTYDLVLLDLKMPGVDGLDVLRYIAGLGEHSPSLDSPHLPPTVILLTAHGSLESAIEALRQGAHDYLLKPSSPVQILNSVKQGLRTRSAQIANNTRLMELEHTQRFAADPWPGAKKPAFQSLYRLPNDITYDPARREITYQTEVILLTPTEGKLVQVFLENPGRVFNHRELVLLVQGYDTKDWEAPEVLRPLVSRLRRKLSRLPEGSRWITSIRGTGYVFDAETMPDET